MTWVLVGAVLATQVVVSVYLQRPDLRYAVPIQPLLMMFSVLFVVLVAGAVVKVVRPARDSPSVSTT